MRTLGSPREEAIQQYDTQTKQMNRLIEIGGMLAGVQTIMIGGLTSVELDVVELLNRAAHAEERDPRPICGFPIGPRHCVKPWRHAADEPHWIEED